MADIPSKSTEAWPRPPKFLLVDYYNVNNGTVFEVAAQHNNVTYTRDCCGLVPSIAGRLYHPTHIPAVSAVLVLAVSMFL